MSVLKQIINRFKQSEITEADRSRLVKGLIHSFIIQGISILLVFAGNFLLVKCFGSQKYGIYVHVFNYISVLAILAANGQEDLVLSRIPKYKAQQNSAQAGAIIRHANVRVAIGGILVSGLFLLFIYLFPIPTLREYRSQFMVASLAIYLSAFLSVNQCILQALDHIRLSQVIERLLKPLLFTVFIGVAALLPFTISANHLIGIAVLNLAICVLVLAWLIINKTRPYVKQGREPYKGVGISKQAFYFLSITLLQLLTSKIGMFMMPFFIAEKNIGIYNISARFSDLIMYPFFLLHTMLPQLFAMHHASDASYNQKLYAESTYIILFLSLPLLLLNIVAGPWLLGYFGQEFTAGYPALIYMSVSSALFGIFGPASTILLMQGKEKLSTFAMLLYVIMLTILSRVLIPVQGITGAALAMLISTVIYNIIIAVYARKHLGVLSPFFRVFAK